jgi:hypothetical protein
MTNMLTIGGTAAAALSRKRRFSMLLGFNLVLQSLAAIIAVACPGYVTQLVGLQLPEEALAIVRVWGLMVIFVSLFQVAGVFSPIETRLNIGIGIFGRLMMTTLYVCLGGVFLVFAVIDGVFAILLTFGFLSAVKAEVMTRP